jgi:hypothetical protein
MRTHSTTPHGILGFLMAAVLAAACSGSSTGTNGGATSSGGSSSGGASQAGGASSAGGSSGGSTSTGAGGASNTGGTGSGGSSTASGGAGGTGGARTSNIGGATGGMGGETGLGGSATGGTAVTGGRGGDSGATGGATGGGSSARGGTTGARGGTTGARGGTTGATGGASGATGGATGATGGASGGSSGRDAGTGGSTDPAAPTTFDNPIIKYDAPDPTAGPGNNIFTADGASMVWNDKVYLYVDKDAATTSATGYNIPDWLLYESSDMIRWESKGSVATCKSISWCTAGDNGGLAAFQVVERDDKNGSPKFYLYGAVNNGSSIVAMVADQPEGPFKDARGIPLIYLDDTANMGATHSWRNLDPTAFVDDDGQAYLAWGNKIYFTVKLEDDMIHLKGETYTADASGKMQNRNISGVKITAHPQSESADWKTYEEAPWLTKHGNLYYLVFASGFPETINYATATAPEGPWQFRGVVISRVQATDASTIHSCLFDFRGASYMGYHSKELPTGSDYRRAECMDRVYYNADGTLKKLVRTHK